MGERRKATAVRLRPNIADRLVREAEARDVSVNWLISRAVERYLDQLVPLDRTP